MSDRVVVIVQSRTGSSRLPGKALRALSGEPMVLHVLRRAAQISPLVWLATSVSERDDQLAAVATEAGFSVFRGSEWDVLRRLAETATVAMADVVVRITGDCPLLAPDVSLGVLRMYRDAVGLYGGDRNVLASNDTNVSGYPDGLDTEVMSAPLLYAADHRATDRLNREHVTPWMRRNAPHVVFHNIEDWRKVKLSVDSVEDFQRVQGVMAHVPPGAHGWLSTRAAYRRFEKEQA